MKTQKGITLIALIITIIVMLILVGVSVSVALNTGLFKTAQGVGKNTQLARDDELILSNGMITINGVTAPVEVDINEYIASLGGGNVASGEKVYITEDNTYTGYYIDINGDGKIEADVDGIIYEDLATAGSGTEFKDYYIQGTANVDFGTRQVMHAEGSGEARFNVMALKDISTVTYTSLEQIEIDSNWFVPSQNQWMAFADVFDVNPDTRVANKLGYAYWSSSTNEEGKYFGMSFDLDMIVDETVYSSGMFVRLSTIF